jgi:transposase
MTQGGPRTRYNDCLRQIILKDLEAGFAPSDLVERYTVSHSFISELRKTWEVYGTVHPERWKRSGPLPKIHTAARCGLLDLLDDEPQTTLAEFVDFLDAEYDIQVSEATVSRTLKEDNITYKRVERTNQAQDPNLRADYYARISDFTPAQCVYVDESAANEHTAHTRMGFSPRGSACRVRYPGRRSKRWSILPALGLNGYIDYEVFHGSYNKERFLLFISRLLLKMNPYGDGVPRCVLVMDNAPIHAGPELQQLCDDAGVLLEFLPPYCPDLNPIEETFHEIKAWLKKNRREAAEYADQGLFEVFILRAIESCVRRYSARGYFQHAGWDVTNADDDVDYSTIVVDEPLFSSENVEVEL